MIAGTKEEPPDAKPPLGRAQHHVGAPFCPVKEKPPDQPSSHHVVIYQEHQNTRSVSQVSISINQIIFGNTMAKWINLQTENSIPCLKPQENKIGSTSLNFCKKPIMHLFLVQNVEIISGTKEVKPEDAPPEKKLMLNHAQSKEASPPKVNNTDDTKWIKATRQKSHAPNQSRDIISSCLLKEEPPDAPHITKSPQSQDNTVSRSKPFQEGEYDEAIKSASTKEHGRDTNQTINTLGENHPKRTKDIYAFIEAYQPNRCWTVTVALFFPCLGFFPMGLPRKVFNEAILSHQGITEKWNWFKSFPHEEDIQVTSQQTSKAPDGDQRLLIGVFRPNHDELICKQTCDTFFNHQGSLSNWNQVNTSFGLRDINFLNRRILDLPYLDPSGFRRLQTYLWRPGDLPHHPETLQHVFLSTKTHRIRRILPHLHFPYPEPSLPYLPCLEPKDIIQQRFFSYSLMCILEPYSVNLDVPRHLPFAPKLSRIKAPLTIFGVISSLSLQQLFLFMFYDFFP